MPDLWHFITEMMYSEIKTPNNKVDMVERRLVLEKKGMKIF